MAGPLWILAVASLVIGVYFTFSHPELPFEPPSWLAATATGVALAGIGLAWATYQRHAIDPETLARMTGPLRVAAARGFWIDEAFLLVYRQILQRMAAVFGWVDRYIVDGVLNVVSAWTVSAGEQLRRVQTGRVQDYVLAVGAGVVAVVWFLGGLW